MIRLLNHLLGDLVIELLVQPDIDHSTQYIRRYEETK